MEKVRSNAALHLYASVEQNALTSFRQLVWFQTIRYQLGSLHEHLIVVNPSIRVEGKLSLHSFVFNALYLIY